MATERLAMKTVKRLLELRFQAKLSQRQTARALGCGKTTVMDYENRAKRRGLTDFSQVKDLSEDKLMALLGLKASFATPNYLRKDPTLLPNWEEVHSDLKKKHVTLALLWSEYREAYPNGYGYSQYCNHYQHWKKQLSVVMRQDHKAGEKAFIDYAGSTVDIIDPNTDEVKPASIFVGVLGASSYTYVDATWSQSLPDWLMSHKRMLEYFSGVPKILIPDNLRSGITKPNRYEAVVNRSYQELAEHYNTCVIPARVRKPKDKAKAEVAVLVVSRWILAALRNRIFHSLEELNEAIVPLLERLNAKNMRHIGKSRKELFDSLDAPALNPLPIEPYQFAQWKQARVNIDHHIECDKHFYSVPYQLIKKEVSVRATATIIEIFYRVKRVASHRISYRKGGYTTELSHRPKSHQAHLEWSPERITRWAKTKGQNVGLFIQALIASKNHPEQGYRAALGVIRLSDKYGVTRLNQACGNAIALGSISYQTVKNMLKNGMDRVAAPTKPQGKQLDFFVSNENVRGSEYYH